MATGVNQYGLFEHLWNHYFEWSGRYTSNALYATYPLVFGFFEGYKFIPLIVFLALFMAAAFLLSAVFNTRMLSRPVLLSALCFVTVYILGMLSPASGLYWMAGAMSYQVANTLFLVELGLMIKLADRQKHSRSSFVLVAVLLMVIVIAIGANETSMLAFIGVALLGLLLHVRSGWAVLKPWLVILLVTLVCFSIIYFSPGNDIRAADFSLRHDLTRSINGSLLVGLKILWIWVSNPVLIVSSLLVPFAITRLLQPSGRPLAVPGSLIAVLLLCTFAMPIMLQFPAWWSMGGWPPARTVDAIYFLFLLSWYLTVSAISVRYLYKGDSNKAVQLYSRYIAVAVLVLSVLFSAAVLESNAFRLAKNDLFYAARPYHEYLNERYDQIDQAKANGQRYLSVPDYRKELPHSIFFNDIMHDPDHWRNVCYANYFGLEKIKREKAIKDSPRDMLNKSPGYRDQGYL